MKGKMKRLLLSAFVGILASTTVAATALIITPASAEAQTSRFAMVEGAGIRYSEPLGLRFIAELGQQEYSELTTEESGVTKQLGMFIMPFEYIDTNDDGTIDVTDYASVATKLTYTFYSSDKSVDNKVYEYEDENGDTYYRANGVISNLKLKNYAREFVGVGYIAETKNGVTTYEYMNIGYNNNVRSAAYVSIEAHADETYADNDTAKRTFVKYIDGAQLYTEWDVTETDDGKYVYKDVTYNSFADVKTAIGTYDYSLSLGAVKYVKAGGSTKLNATITDATNGVTFDGAHAVYTSSDESVVTVKNGMLNWVKNGTATITATFMDATTTCEVISGAIDFEDGLPSYVTQGGRATVSVVDGELNVKAETTANGENNNNNARTKLDKTYMAALLEENDYIAFDLKFASDFDTTNGNPKTIYYRDYTTKTTWTQYCDYSYNATYETVPIGYYQTYYYPKTVYEACIANNVSDVGIFLNVGKGILEGSEGYYVDNIRAVTAEEKEAAYNWYSFEYGGIRYSSSTVFYLYSHESTGSWQLQISGVDSNSAKYVNNPVSDGTTAVSFTKVAGTSRLVLNHTADPSVEVAMRNAGYIAYDLYVPEGSDAAAVQDNSSGVYAKLKQGWNTLYAKVEKTGVNTGGDVSNNVCAFWDSTASTYTIDNIRFLTEEQYNWEMLSFEGKAGVLRDSTSDEASTAYIYTPRDVLSNRWTMAVGNSAVLSNLHYDTETVKDGKQSFSFHKADGYTAFSFNTGGEMYALLKNGFTFWVYADLDEKSGINGNASANNFGNGANGLFNGGEGLTVKARTWTKVVVTADDINASGRWLIIQGSTAGTYYFDGIEPLENFTVTYDAGVGSVASETQSVGYGAYYNLATPTSYRDFLGWYDGDELVPTTGTWNIAEDVTLTAKYSDKVSFEDGVVPTYMVKADSTTSLSVVDGGLDGEKILQITGGTGPAMTVTRDFLASFFEDSSVDYIAFDAKTGTSRTDNFRRHTWRSNNGGEYVNVKYEADNSYTGIYADAWKSFYFSRADYNHWIDNGDTVARLIASGGITDGDSIYVDNIRAVTADEYTAALYSFESGGIRTDNGNQPLLYIGEGQWQLGISNLDSTTAQFTNEIVSDGIRAVTFTKKVGDSSIVFNHNTDTWMENEMRNAGYISFDLYVPEGSDATMVKIAGSAWYGKLQQGWNTIYAEIPATGVNKGGDASNILFTFTDTTASTYVIDKFRLLSQAEYEEFLPKYFYNAEGEMASDGTVTGLVLNGGTHDAGTTTSTAMPVAADNTTDMAYYKFDGTYGLNDFLVFDFTGNNMPIISFFTSTVTNSVYNHAMSEDNKGWIFFNGIYNHNGLPDGGYSGNLSNRLNLIGPYKITYKADNSNGETPLSNRTSDGSNPTNPNPVSLAQLNGSTDQYRAILGWVESGSEMHLCMQVWNLTTGAVLYSKTIDRNLATADWEGDIVLYGHFGKTTNVDKVYPIQENTTFETVVAEYQPAMQTYNATWDGNGLTLGTSTYEGAVNRPDVGSTDMSYIAFNGDYSYGDYLVFDFTGENMPIVSFFNNEVTNTVYNNASVTASAAGIADANAHGIVICGGLYQNGGSIWSSGTVNAARLIIVGYQKVLGWDDNSNSAVGGFRTSDGSVDSPSPLSITGLQGVTDTYRVIMGFSAKGTLEVRVINMTTGELIYNLTKGSLTQTLESGSIAMHGQFGKTTVLDTVFGIEEDTTIDELLSKYAKDTDYSDETAVELDRYAYSGPSHGQWTIDGVNQVENVIDYRTVEQYTQYKNAGFNILLAQDAISVSTSTWETQGKVFMDRAYEAGLKVILTDGRLQNLSEPITISGTTVNGTAWTIGDGGTYSNQAALDIYVNSCLSLYKDHPAFYGVMLGDEPSYQNAWCYGQTYQSIKRVMPECYVQYNLNPMQHDNYNMVVYWYGGTSAGSTPTDAETEAAYKSYVEAFLDAMGTDYIQYDDYPFKSATEGAWFWEKSVPYVDPTALRNIQIVAEIAKERNLDVKVVTQSCVMRSGGEDGNVVIRQVTEDDARWLNNYLMGFGVKQISYFTYWTKSANSASGEWFDDGGSFVKRDGTTTALYDIMKTIMAENTAFAKTISHFDYNASKVVTGSSYKYNDEHIVWGTLSSDSLKYVTSVTTSTDATLVTELYDKENYNHMYMVMNTIDPYEKNGNSKDTTQSITITLDSSITQFYVYDQSGNRSLQTGNTYTVSLTAGQAVYLMPIL